MNKDKFRNFGRGRHGHRRGKFKRLIMIALPILLIFSIFSAFAGGHCGHRRGGGDHHGGEFAGHWNKHREAPAASANVPSTSAPNSAASTSNSTDDLTVISDVLQEAVENEVITQQQANSIVAKQVREGNNSQVSSNPSTSSGTTQAPAAEASSNSNTQAPQQEFRGRNRDSNRHRHGFSPIGFLIGGLFKLGFLMLLFSLLSRFFGFRPWRRSLGFRRWQQAYAHAWGEPAREETPVPPEDEDIFSDDIARELEREEQAQKAKQSASDGDQPAKKEDANDSDRDSNEPPSEDKKTS